MVHFRVGDKARVIVEDHPHFKMGHIFKVDRVDIVGDVYDENSICVLKDRVELVVEKPTKNQRITSLEKELSEVKNELSELRLVVNELCDKKSIEHSTTNTVEDKQKTGSPKHVRYIGEIKKPIEKSLNQQRAEIIERAKKFVEVKSECLKDSPSVLGGFERKEKENPNFNSYIMEVEFFINKEKHAITALCKSPSCGLIRTKGIAKCNPSDVFNEHIGKAIALGRALGLDVSEFEQAVQPTEFAVGQVVEANYEDPVWAPFTISELNNKYNEGLKLWDSTDGCFISADKAKIINDTKAKYGEG